MSFFVRIKSWQLFILFIGLPVINNALIFHVEPSPFLLINGNFLTKSVIVLWGFCYISWLYSIGKLLYQMPKVMKIVSFRLFRFNCLFVIIYSTLQMILSSFVPITLSNFDSVIGIVMPFHFYSMFAMFYILKSVAKMLQLSRAMTQENNFIRVMFKLGVFPVGVWTIQPIVNKIYSDLQLKQKVKPELDKKKHE